ncbi:putative Efflux pump antibiotic resistance protein [Venustampulla echinocandica]|uniref:Putative Efflux pump antibiotic resistance protein n=1 Tax=Venustampulla echinocandica TaxID=2656787 RepID=A0A370TMI9_9HELO|nr:putative Efflux pump antibiotic resistance protein [Venustampulla echinocandica]RDL36727.1 putative Efflux pump antibiotic resistance protein [Venustampulla echinocandica]
MDTSTTGVTGNVINFDPMESNEKTINTTDAEPISTTNAQADGDEPEYLGPWELFPIAIAMGLAIFIIGLARTSTPTISNEFHALTDIGWYGSAYRLTTCSTQFFYGKLYEQFRVKWVLAMAVAILELGSIVSAAAPSSTAFIIGRAISGCGASGIITGVFIAIAHSVPLHLRPIYNSTVGALECIASIVAPVIGGALTTYVSWRWCFWLNMPVGGFTIVVLVFFFKNSQNQKINEGSVVSKLKQLNFLHLFVFSGSIVCLLLALEWGGTTYSWSSGRIIGLLVVSGVAFAVFVALEVLRRESAIIPRSVLFNKTVGLCVLYAFCASAAFNLTDYFLPIWFQAIKDASPAKSGQMLLPSIISLSVAAISSGFILSVIGYYTPLMLLGSTMMAIGFGFLTSFKPNTGRSAWIGWQVMYGIGMGLAIPQPWSAIQTALAVEDIPAGMTAVAFAISTGAALFISISQNIFMNLLRQGLLNIPDVDVDSIIKQGATNLLQTVPASDKSQVIDVYNFAVTRTFWSCVAVVCLGMVAALVMDWNSVKKAERDEDVGKERS